MSLSGPNNASSVINATAADGVVNWETPSNAATEDATYAWASVTTVATKRTHFLKFTNFCFNIPSDAMIAGIKIDLKRYSSANNTRDYTRDQLIKLVINGIESGTNKANTGLSWPTSLTFATYGGETDLWGLSLSSSDINNTNFGFSLQANLKRYDTAAYAYVDVGFITIYYSLGSSSAIFRRSSQSLFQRIGSRMVR